MKNFLLIFAMTFPIRSQAFDTRPPADSSPKVVGQFFTPARSLCFTRSEAERLYLCLETQKKSEEILLAPKVQEKSFWDESRNLLTAGLLGFVLGILVESKR